MSIFSLIHRRYFSSILNPNPSSPLSSKQKTRLALSLIKSETNPERILDICRHASLTPETHLDRVVFSVAISKLTESKYFDGIRSFLEELKTRPDLKTERFNSHAMVLYGQAGMIPHAIDTFRQMPQLGIDPTVKSLNSLLFACVLAKKYEEVNRVFLDFSKDFGIVPDLGTYLTVIKAFCEMGSSNSGFSILAEMDRKGCKPNASVFGTLLAGFYNEEKYEEVGKILNLMEKYKINQGVSTYNIRIKSLCKLKKSEEAKALFDGMLSRRMKPNSVTYCYLIHGFCKEGKYEEAKGLFKRMVNSGCVPDSDCYFTLVYFLCQGGDFEAALEICKESMAKGWVPNFGTMKLLVNGLVSISKVEEAREIIGLVKGKVSRNTDMWKEVEEGLPQ